MKGTLVVNPFLAADSFRQVQGLVERAAEKKNISLSVKTTVDLLDTVRTPPKDPGDFVLFWDKDVLLAKRLEAFGIPLFNSAEAIRLCDSKGETALALAAKGISTPETVLAPLTYDGIGYTQTDFVLTACERLGLPVVIKELFGSFGAQVYLADTVEEAMRIVASLGARPFLFQAFVAASRGRDVRVNVVGDRVVASMLRKGREGDFRSNIGQGGAGEAFALSDEAAALAVAACGAVGADFAGVDLLFTPDGMTVCEVNSNPQFAGTYRYLGVNMAEHILEYIQTKI